MFNARHLLAALQSLNTFTATPAVATAPKHHAGHSKSRRTAAQDKRAALKRRNVARHKARVAGRRT